MNKPRNTHQILYAKNFYQHSGNIIADMRKICKLDQPEWDFSSPYQILKFMRNQYNIWLDNNPEINKERGSKVAWESDPIKAEIWSILGAYSIYIPFTEKHIGGLPDYNVLKPQYNACFGFYIREEVFNRSMTVKQLTERAKEILNRPNVENMDIIADDACKRFNYKKASKILAMFGEQVSPEELDEELWDLYSELVGQNLDEDGQLKETSYYAMSKHFTIRMAPEYKSGSSFSFDIEFVPVRRFEYVTEEVANLSNFRNLVVMAKTKAAYDMYTEGCVSQISEVCKKLYEDEDSCWDDVPKHLTEEPDELLESILDDIDAPCKLWEKFNYSDVDAFDHFEKCDNKYHPRNGGCGCFSYYLYNDNGKVHVIIEFNTLFENSLVESELWNSVGYIDSPKN